MCHTLAGISPLVIRWALSGGPVHRPVLPCGTWSSPNACRAAVTKVFSILLSVYPKSREGSHTETFGGTRMQVELLTFEVGVAISWLRI